MSKTLLNGLLYALPLLALPLGGCPGDIFFTDNYETVVTVDDQEVDDNGDILIRYVTPYYGQWLAIHRDDNGAPSTAARPIGGIRIDVDRYENVKVRLDSAVAPGERLWAVMHIDNGIYDTFEYDGVDTTDHIYYDSYYGDAWDDFIVR
jgi:hypothetical protein